VNLLVPDSRYNERLPYLHFPSRPSQPTDCLSSLLDFQISFFYIFDLSDFQTRFQQTRSRVTGSGSEGYPLLMDEARLMTSDGERFYTAGEIWSLPNAKDLDWRCLGSEKKFTPWAWEKRVPPFRVRAHFKALDGHDPNCRVGGLEALLTQTGTRLIQAQQGLTSLVPTLVEFPERRPVMEPGTSSDSIPGGETKAYLHDGQPDKCKQRPPHQRWARSLDTVSLCHSRMSIQAQKYFQLNVEGCDGGTYFDVFHPLYDLEPVEAAPIIHRSVVYGKLLFKRSLDFNDEFGPEIELLAGRRVRDSMQRKPAFKVRVDWRVWTARERTTFRKQFESQRLELQDKYYEAKRKGEAALPSMRVYFLGSQNSENPFMFFVDDLRKLCFVHRTLSDKATGEYAVIEEKRRKQNRTNALLDQQRKRGSPSTVWPEHPPPVQPIAATSARRWADLRPPSVAESALEGKPYRSLTSDRRPHDVQETPNPPLYPSPGIFRKVLRWLLG
jgi:hypothetical protein